MKKTYMVFLALAICAGSVFGATGMANAQTGMYSGGDPYYANMTPEVQAAMQKHWNTVAPLRQQLYAKQAELDAKIASGASDSEISSITKEVNSLSAKLNEAQVQMQQAMAKQGMPYGGYMGGYGHGGGMGYGHGGPACCW
ncbi:hypothetical protein [uncultured Desulfovibrio sp.]|uniref:hypothetical protein n=1 Tax=uncultured Desulfovibrio sp. TaxID=167968 RepID=UPI00261A0AD7|nr:hypothetical protein [uncultured Desulfovibrio sp.]